MTLVGSVFRQITGVKQSVPRISPSTSVNQMEGNKVLAATYLQKRSSKTHQWKKKWVCLRKCQLSYYKDSSEHKPIKVINKLNLLSYSTIPDHQKCHFAIYTNKKVLHFKTDDTNLFNTWVNVLEEFFKDDFIEEKSATSLHDEAANTDINVDPNRKNHLTIKTEHSSIKSESTPSLSNRKKSITHQSISTDYLNRNLTDIEYTGPEDVSSGFSDFPLTHQESIPPIIKEQPIIHEEEEDLDRLQRLKINNQALENLKPSDHTLESLHENHPQEEHMIEEGYLLRLRKRYNQWKRFFLILTNQNLYFYKKEDMFDRTYKIIPVTDIIDVIELDPLSKSKLWCILIITPLKRLRFCAESEEEMIKWLSVLKMVIMRRKLN
jgi:hypothetical protein